VCVCVCVCVYVCICLTTFIHNIGIVIVFTVTLTFACDTESFRVPDARAYVLMRRTCGSRFSLLAAYIHTLILIKLSSFHYDRNYIV
jgi:hypothetical protein